MLLADHVLSMCTEVLNHKNSPVNLLLLQTVLPKVFLRIDENKRELFQVIIDEGKVIYAKSEVGVLSSLVGADFQNLSPCSH